MPELTPQDSAALARAVRELEHTSLAARVTYMFGKQIELAGKYVPEKISGIVNKAVGVALKSALKTALMSLDNTAVSDSRQWHKSMAALSGAAGGAFGLAALPIELPVSTTIMLRSIADIARAEGENLADPETALACLQVFALGSRQEEDDYMESSYFAVRALLAKSISEAARYVVQKGVADQSAPIIVKLMGQIAARFGIVVSQKLAAQSVPVIGAAGGALINYAFIDHFQNIARGHFTVRRLEKTYGAVFIKLEYDRLADAEKNSPKS